MFELAPIGSAGELLGDAWLEVDWMRRLSAAIERPVSYVLLQVDDDPDLWRKQLAASLEACAEGAQLYPQIAGRPTGLLTGHHATYCLFSDIPAYRELRRRQAVGGRPGRRPGRPRAAPGHHVVDAVDAGRGRGDGEGVRAHLRAGRPARLRAGARALAGRPGRGPGHDAAGGGLRRDGGRRRRGALYLPILNYATGDLDHVYDMLQHPRGLLGLSDGGAHTGTICDASMPTFMLTHWTRDRTRGATLPLEYVVKKQTHDTARLYGLSDRGTVEVGALADFNVIDYDALALGTPFVRNDLPAGGRRLLQRAAGYVCTIKKGTVTFEDGEPTGELPGRLLRGAR